MTSLALGLGNAEKCIDLCRPMLQILSMDGNGKVMATIPGKQLKFLSDNWPEHRFELMPIPNLYSSVTNWCCYDWYANLGRNCEVDYDDTNLQLLAELALKDMVSHYPWSDEKEKQSQRVAFDTFVAKHELEMPDESK